MTGKKKKPKKPKVILDDSLKDGDELILPEKKPKSKVQLLPEDEAESRVYFYLIFMRLIHIFRLSMLPVELVSRI